ncbi:MAG TPA: tRNA (adenosine(37)-N6)-dimethylallyltransferase MiaA [Bacillota bacterium]|nr:tRNA (adenosine(37)-N6)-dimethylallyltransferase MiaA [Bacillota bacterium]HOL10619.1 tRNA (adenosine(37)-N6)-dimethylallyltransferase MiaA [Bacillota bacterium]HPO98576.1 tRNA (adenosine(37)-N6)-dimethylallyltransferase MiaA [Bacillota bacterium]
MRPIIIIAGPTAVGKTDLAIRLAQDLKTEIISADSMQVYKYLDIGTAKPTASEQRQAKHHLIDIVEPDQNFSVADYQRLFDQKIADFNNADQIPLVAGGTGLYIRACIQQFALDNPADPDWNFREQLKQLAASKGSTYLHDQLATIDPEAAGRIHPNDLFRIIRALEVYHKTGTPISKLQYQKEFKYPSIFIFLNRDREELYRRIELRVDLMITEGLIDEVAGLLKMGYSPELKPMKGLGYQQICDYLAGKISKDEAISLIKQKTRNYAKRQITWFKKEPIDLIVNLSEKREDFYYQILKYIEGRLNSVSNR